jgi:hypothetical protein
VARVGNEDRANLHPSNIWAREGNDCWDQIAEGYLIPNTGKRAKVGACALENGGYKGLKHTMDKVINALSSSLRGDPQGVYL